MDRLKEMCQILRNDPNVIGKIEDIVGTSIEDLEQEWHGNLMQIDVPSVGHAVPGDAEVVFSMDDPEADDVGDGDYIYPNARFEKGVFDLRRFEVFKDSSLSV